MELHAEQDHRAKHAKTTGLEKHAHLAWEPCMNFLEMISAHVRWKQRLRTYIQDKSEPLDPAMIRRDDQCRLGKWIYGPGQSYKQSELFEKVRAEHASFHKHAAAVVTFVNRGDRDLATEVLNGEYARVSNNLKRDIIALAQEVGSSPDDATQKERA